MPKKPTIKRIKRAGKLPLKVGIPHAMTNVLVVAALAAGFLLTASALWPSISTGAGIGMVGAHTTTAKYTPATARKSVPHAPKYCGHTQAATKKINTVIVISEENRTWSQVGLGYSASTMPYAHMLAAQCAYFTQDSEVNTLDNSAQQYVGAWTGYDSTITHVRKSCRPSQACSYTKNNIFRAFRNAGIAHREYVEGATDSCSASGNVPRHVPELYMWDQTDIAACNTEVLPLSQFNFASPATGFSFITPTMCNDGHDCNDNAVDAWLAAPSQLPALLNSPAYKSGQVLVELWWDESGPKPNLFACWSCKQVVSDTDPHYSGESLLWLNLLGSPTGNLGEISTATDIRSIIGAR